MEKAAPTGASDVPAEPVLRQIRIPHIQRGRLRHAGGDEDVLVIDVGLLGVFVEREAALPIGATVEISFLLPGNGLPLNTRCRVAWWHPPRASLLSKVLPAGVGLEFVEMSEADAARLREHVVDYCRRQPRERYFLPRWPQGEEEGEAP